MAEELAQEALARACERWTQVSQMAAPGAWVHRVAMNLAASWFRRRAAERRAHARVEAGGGPVEVDAAEAVAIRQAVLALPVRQRSVLGLRYFAGMSVAETADVLGVTVDAVKAHTRRAVAQLREQLVEEVVEHE